LGKVLKCWISPGSYSLMLRGCKHRYRTAYISNVTRVWEPGWVAVSPLDTVSAPLLIYFLARDITCIAVCLARYAIAARLSVTRVYPRTRKLCYRKDDHAI